jgi:acetyl esterase/lipase
MDLKHRMDPELVEPLEGVLAAMGGGLDLGDLAATRAMVGGMIAAIKAEVPKTEGLDIAERQVPGFEGDPAVKVRIYRPSGRSDALPALLWIHAGGWVLGDLELEDLMAAQIAKDVQCAVFAVDYRLAPEHPYPAPLRDCYAALQWLASRSGELNVDAARIAVGGSSAGGNLATAVSLMARDRGEAQPAFQLLIYPALDDSNVTQASETAPDTPFWTRENALHAWSAYLGREPGSAGVEAYAAPIRATDLSDLPPAYIAVGEIDLFFDENVEYARRLIAAGVPTELHVYPGAYHAFDVFTPMGRISQQFVADRNTVLRRVLRT